MRTWFGSSLALAAMLGCAQMATATPVAPSMPVNSWLMDTTVNDGKSIPAYTGSNVADATRGGGAQAYTLTSVDLQDEAPFSYSGNKSVRLGPYVNGAGPLQGSLRADNQGNSPIAVGTNGTVSFWFNPVKIDYSIAADGAYFFNLRNKYHVTAPNPAGRVNISGTNAGPDGHMNIEFGSNSSSAVIAEDLFADPPNPGFDFNYSGIAGPKTSFTAGNWYNIVATWSGTGMAVYLDGQKVSDDASNPITDTFLADIFAIGAYNASNTNEWPGLYDEFAYWNSTLTTGNIEWLAANSITSLNPIPEPGSALLLAMGLFGFARLRRRRLAA